MRSKLIIISISIVVLDNSGDSYNEEIRLNEEVCDLMRHLFVADYQIIALTNHPSLDSQHIRILLKNTHLFSEAEIYSAINLKTKKPAETFLRICHERNKKPSDCIFIDNHEDNIRMAEQLGMHVIKYISASDCLEKLVNENILTAQTIAFDNVNAIYPSLYDLVEGQGIVKWNPQNGEAVLVDDYDENGNLRKRSFYESELAKLICEEGRAYWENGYHKLNQLFLADFDLKTKPNTPYILKVETCLKKLGLIEPDSNPSTKELRRALVQLFSKNFDMTAVSQFYYEIWLESHYGPEPLEPFVFQVDEIKNNQAEEKKEFHNDEVKSNFGRMYLLALSRDISHKADSRKLAYFAAQYWLFFGPPQLRGRIKRESGSPLSTTIGILRDNDPYAKRLQAPPHFAAKNAFRPTFEHEIARELKQLGGPIIGGPSGTLGRNFYMLAPLLESGLLTAHDLHQYLMGFYADLVYRGHHSLEECAVVMSHIISSSLFKSWFNPIQTPVEFYAQFLTPGFINSDSYKRFVESYEGFFDAPIAPSQRR
ncbi:hypothetical protein [Coxiella burnetii]|uniref:hypothetical protein n=1 Tax=Coxiella burnetii TaxID=777 RepID=UPI0005A74AFF|nr:hypothetical protein [Coxiella burnetii]